MTHGIRHRTVAVAVIYDKANQSFLLCHNKRWGGYAFPMKHFDPATGVTASQAALNAVNDPDFPLPLPDATAEQIDSFGECLFSDGVRQNTYYDYHVIDVDPGVAIKASQLHPDLRFFSCAELLDAINVTSSTKSVARSLVEDRKVALAVITRSMRGEREFLLVYNKSYEYFFSATRLKANGIPAEAVGQAVQNDLGYKGPMTVVAQEETPSLQWSQRFGPRESRFYFYSCLLRLVDELDLTATGNALEQELNKLQDELAAQSVPTPYWGWFSEKDMRTRADMSPSMETVLATVLSLAERNA